MEPELNAPQAFGLGRRAQPRPEDINADLGFGQRVATESRRRLLNPDGSFNVIRKGVPFLEAQSGYHSMLTMSWPRFYALIFVCYIVMNLLFGAIYVLCGPHALGGVEAVTPGGRYLEAFFFSVQTLSTIGYGHITPISLASNLVMTLEAVIGWMTLAVAAGLLFSRFARPTARVIFSRQSIIAPYQGIRAFEFRLANVRKSQLTNVEATVVMTRLEQIDGVPKRRFYNLDLERSQVTFLPLHWVVVHPINESSPLYGVNEEQLRASDAEFLILLTALDETFSQVVHTRSSYKHDEVVWGAQFVDIFRETASEDGVVSIDLRAVHDVQPAV